jgi:Recombination endonuclease VII
MVIMDQNSFRVMRILTPATLRHLERPPSTCHPDRVSIAGNGMCKSCYPRFVKYKINFKEIYDKQNGNCAVCSVHFDENLLEADHDHLTNKFRALVCHGCNRRVGVVEHSGFTRHATFPLILNYITSHAREQEESMAT